MRSINRVKSILVTASSQVVSSGDFAVLRNGITPNGRDTLSTTDMVDVLALANEFAGTLYNVEAQPL